MHALIDADRIPYAFGGFKDDDGHPLQWPLIAERVDSNINSIMDGSGATSGSLYLTSDDKSNYRISVATIRPYKGHRSTEKSFWYEQIRRYLINEHGAIVVHGMEADDAIGIKQCTMEWGQLSPGNTIICSVDKDLNMISGYHYNELKQERYWVSETEALKSFYTQLLTGDPTDNIPGLYGVGPKASSVSHISKCDNELSMYMVVREEYEKRFGSYWEQFLEENAGLLWIKRTAEKKFAEDGEILFRLWSLEEKRLNLEVDSKTESVNN